jgi:hypothetical protein
MTKDPYWDELGIAWVTFDPSLSDLTPALESRARRELWLFRAGIVIAAGFSSTGLLLGTWTIWLGVTSGAWNFAIRGIAILIIALLAAIAGRAFWLENASNDAGPVAQMINLAVARAKRLLLTIRLGLFACAVAAVFGVIGTAVRSQLSKPPNLSPIIDLVLLALAAVSLSLYGHWIKAELAKFEYIKQVLEAG